MFRVRKVEVRRRVELGCPIIIQRVANLPGFACVCGLPDDGLARPLEEIAVRIGDPTDLIVRKEAYRDLVGLVWLREQFWGRDITPSLASVGSEQDVILAIGDTSNGPTAALVNHPYESQIHGGT